MRDIKDIREDIDKIDNSIKKLFIDRLSLSKEISEYKKKNNLPIYDKAREDEIVENRTKDISDKTIKDLYTEFLYSIFSFSKKYQEKLNQ